MGRVSPEHLLQVQLIERVRLELVPRWPVLAGEGWPDSGALRLYAVPNGGLRTVQEGVRLKMEGVQKGVPDLVLPIARGGFHGLYLELKAAGGRTSREQDGWLAFLDDQGYRVAVAWTVERAFDILVDYMTQEEGATPGGPRPAASPARQRNGAHV